MKIAIDIDDTLNEAHKCASILLKPFCDTYGLDYQPLRPEYQYIKQQFTDWSQEMIKKFDSYEFPFVVRESSVKPNVLASLNELISMGHELYIVTRRNPFYVSKNSDYHGYKMVRDTYAWIKDKKLPFDKDHIIFGINNKAEYCKANGFNVLIDDCGEQARLCHENNFPMVLMTQPFNQHLLNEYDNLISCTNWNQIPEIISNIK